MDKIDAKGYSVVHEWAKTGEAWPCKLLLEEGDVGDARTKIFSECIFEKEKRASETPLHLAARKKDSELGHLLIRGYQQQVSVMESENEELVAIECPPWKITNILGNTPLHSALYATSKHEDLALEILSIDPTSYKIRNNKGESPFFLAVKSACSRVVDEIIRIEVPRFDMIHRNDKTTVLHCLSSCPEDTCKALLNNFWWIINCRDDQGNTALDYARNANIPWLVDLLTNPFAIQKHEFDWVDACKSGETAAILAFISNCPYLKRECEEKKDTPLHHIKLPTYREYINFLQISSISELKDITDHDGATPLHRALEREDMLLAKVLLLDDHPKLKIRDNNGRSARELLVKLCKENDDWEKMCTQIQVNPYLQTTICQLLGGNLDEMRTTMSVVAALFVTISFGAAFTIPGSFDEEGKGTLVMSSKLALFVVADTYSLITSIISLFLSTWSMNVRTDQAWSLLRYSVIAISQSFYGTMIAFMVGINLLMEDSPFFVDQLIPAMCVVVGVLVHMCFFNIKGTFKSLFARFRKKKKTQVDEEEMEMEIITSLLKEMEIITTREEEERAIV